MNELFSNINGFFEAILFFDIFFGQIEGVSFPFVSLGNCWRSFSKPLKWGFENLKMLPKLFRLFGKGEKYPHKRWIRGINNPIWRL